MATAVRASNTASNGSPAQDLSRTGSVAGSVGKHHKFDVIVIPNNSACELLFEVTKNQVFNGMHKDDLPKYGCKWKWKSGIISNPTTIQVTIPAVATSWKFVVRTNLAQNSSVSSFGFEDKAIEVFEDKKNRGHQNRLVFHDPKLVKPFLPKNASVQTMTIDESSPVEKEDETQVVKDPKENKSEP